MVDPETLPKSDALVRLRTIMHILRSPGGCPWDQEQSHESLLPNLIEEAYETADAIRSGDTAHMEEELGDLLLQVIFHGELGSETGAFDVDSIANRISEKLIHRHPHVFGESEIKDTEGVLRQWEEIKQSEKGDAVTHYLDGITQGLPALIRAQKIQKKAAKVGFDWPEAASILDKIREETAEVEEAMQERKPDKTGEEIGDLLFAVVNLARRTGHDAEGLLAAANEKFIGRFREVEASLTEKELSLKAATLDQMEAAWQAAKSESPSPPVSS